jgi:hypothetical protein
MQTKVLTAIRELKKWGGKVISDTAEKNEKFILLSRNQTRIFGYLDRRSTNWATESRGIGSSFIPFNW